MSDTVATVDRSAQMAANALLRTKLFIPQVRHHQDLLPRPRLIERLQVGLARKLTLISAPAGYGKTVLLAEFIPHSERCVTWLALDETDNDLARFLTYVIATLQLLKADFGQSLLVVLQAPEPPPVEELMTQLVNRIAHELADFALVLDDYHLIQQPAVHAALTFLLSHPPPNMHLIITSRADPPLPLARLRVRSEMTELRAADLRFTLEETTAFFHQIKALPLAAAQVQALDQRTEGWGAGLHLAALSLHGLNPAAVTRFIGDFTGSHANVFDYLAEEVLHQQPADVQQFLLHSSVLSRLCAELCDAVLRVDENSAGRHDAPPAAAILDYLEQANLFLLPLDQRRHWYRYHHLFGDFLRQRLTQEIGQAGVYALYHRARRWHEQQDLVDEAINYALAAHDWPTAVGLLQKLTTSLWSSSRHLLKWIESLPQEEVDQSPDLCMWYANWLMLGGEFSRVATLLGTAERVIRASGQLAKLTGLYAYRAMASFMAEDGQQTIDHARQALAYLDDENRFLHPHVLDELARGYFLNGEPAEAERLWAATHALAQSPLSPRVLLFIRAAQGELQQLRGKRRQAVQLDQELLKQIGDRPIDILKIRALTRLARQAYEWNQLAQAEHYARQALAVTGTTPREVFVRSAHLLLARIDQARGATEQAQQTIAHAKLLAERLGGEHPLLEVNAHQVRLWLALATQLAPAAAHQHLQAALAWAAAQRFTPERELTYADQLTHVALCRVYLAQQRPDQALPLLGQLVAAVEAADRGGELIELLALQALAYQAHNQPSQALATLAHALRLAEPEGYLRTFVDEGAAMAALLATLRAQSDTTATAYLETLLAAFPVAAPLAAEEVDDAVPAHPPFTASTHPASRTMPPRNGATQPVQVAGVPLIEPLSKRELEILALLAQGLTNPEIAQQLYVSAETVKVHTRNIYGKLGVNSRRQAVTKARALGMLT